MFDIAKFLVWNKEGLRHQISKIYWLENVSLRQQTLITGLNYVTYSMCWIRSFNEIVPSMRLFSKEKSYRFILNSFEKIARSVNKLNFFLSSFKNSVRFVKQIVISFFKNIFFHKLVKKICLVKQLLKLFKFFQTEKCLFVPVNWIFKNG